MMSIPGMEFEPAWDRRVEVQLQGLVVPFISKSDLMASKEACCRPQDLIDLENLRKTESQ